MSLLDNVGLQFREAMSGHLGADTIRFDVQIRIDDLPRFLRQPDHKAALSGTVTFPPLGGTFPIRDGSFNLFQVDPETGMRRMVYEFAFTAADGRDYYLRGHKEIFDNRGDFDLVEDMTRLYTRLHRGNDASGEIYGEGELYFKLKNAPAMAASMEVLGAKSWRQRLGAYTAFASFAFGALREEYMRDVRLFYDTQYENLVLSGVLETAEVPFFFVSGTHDKGFPWGDNECFWDVLLAIGDGKGSYLRFAITDRVLEGMDLDIDRGTYRYLGPLFRLAEGYSASFSQMKRGAAHLEPCEADIRIEFEPRPFDAVPFPFPLVRSLMRRMSSAMVKRLREALPGEHALGIHIQPHAVAVRSGAIRIRSGSDWLTHEISPPRTFGECEKGSFKNLKEPTMLYSYVCAVRPAAQAARVQILTRTLRDEREHWVKDRLDAFVGSVVSRTASAEMLIEGGSLRVNPAERAKLLRKLGSPLVEANNDHYPTAVLQRRIVEVLDPSGERCLGLEEDMSCMRLEPIGCDRKVTVASLGGEDKFQALGRTLDETGFDELLEAKLAASGKPREEFLIAIKPNFMFAYDKRDQTTYTDPELVGRLVERLRASGFRSIKVVEAQSTYGEYFDKRSVREVADYLGYDGRAGYEVVDMTEDASERQQFGAHLGLHPVSRVWKSANFRISFAKNKTHAYSYYTLTLKNIYGALPMANKFKEYHCARDIYHTTIEYLSAFPVDFGLVDGWVSADGPFGIFADPAPNETHTIIGGADLVAVDWVAATRMGIDTMISPHMRLAVEAFGKPEIHLVGDANPYRPWLNVPVALTLCTHKGMDASFHFGNLLYMVSSQMDETHFRHKSRAWHIRLLRRMTVPLRRTFFVRTGEDPSAGNRFMSWLLYRLGY